jgi:hypothetical protein
VASSAPWCHYRVPTNGMILVFSHKPSLTLQPFTCQFLLNIKKRITSKGLQTRSQQRNTRKYHRCPLKLEDIMTDYVMDISFALGTAQYIQNWAHPYCSKRYMFPIGDTLHFTRSPIWNTDLRRCVSIAYHHYVVNIHFEWVQSSLESCTTSKFADRFAPTSCQMKWRSMFMSI